MTRITKKIAEDCSKAALVKLTQKAERIEQMFKEYAINTANEYIPEAVKLAFSDPQCRPFIHKSGLIYLAGEGIGNWECKITLDFSLPYHNPIQVSSAHAKELRAYMDKLSSLRAEISNKRREIEVAVLSLGTYAKVEKEFPEVYQYLPKMATQTLPAKNLDLLRDFIKNL